MVETSINLMSFALVKAPPKVNLLFSIKENAVIIINEIAELDNGSNPNFSTKINTEKK